MQKGCKGNAMHVDKGWRGVGLEVRWASTDTRRHGVSASHLTIIPTAAVSDAELSRTVFHIDPIASNIGTVHAVLVGLVATQVLLLALLWRCHLCRLTVWPERRVS